MNSGIVFPEGELLRCAACGQLLSTASAELYQKASIRWEDITRVDQNPRIHRKRLKYISKNLRKSSGARLLDVGCSFGIFLKVAAQQGFIVEGVETSKNAADYASQQGMKVRYGYLEELGLPADYYDVVTIFEVIEHLKSPYPLLSECRRILKPNGLLVLSTPNTGSWTCLFLKEKWTNLGVEEAGHISLFNRKSLGVMAHNAGFELAAYYSRGVSLYTDKDKFPLLKIASELLQVPAKVFKKGHDAIIILKKKPAFS